MRTCSKTSTSRAYTFDLNCGDLVIEYMTKHTSFCRSNVQEVPPALLWRPRGGDLLGRHRAECPAAQQWRSEPEPQAGGASQRMAVFSASYGRCGAGGPEFWRRRAGLESPGGGTWERLAEVCRIMADSAVRRWCSEVGCAGGDGAKRLAGARGRSGESAIRRWRQGLETPGGGTGKRLA